MNRDTDEMIGRLSAVALLVALFSWAEWVHSGDPWAFRRCIGALVVVALTMIMAYVRVKLRLRQAAASQLAARRARTGTAEPTSKDTP